jgi:hypothetical protein
MLSSNERGGGEQTGRESRSVAKEARASDGMACHALDTLLSAAHVFSSGQRLAGSLSRIANPDLSREIMSVAPFSLAE